VSSSAEHDSSKFTNRNGQGDYFVASSIDIYIEVLTKGKQRWGTRRKRERESEGGGRKEVSNRMCAYVLSALCVHRNCGKTSTLGNTKRDTIPLSRFSYSAVLWIFHLHSLREFEKIARVRVFLFNSPSCGCWLISPLERRENFSVETRVVYLN